LIGGHMLEQVEPSSALGLYDALRRLDQLTDWERRPRGGMKVGLSPILDLLNHLGNPHESFRSVQVTGTKGKGSVSNLIDVGLRRAGWRVGRYSSPHVERITERISILGEEVSEARLAAAISSVLDAYEKLKSTNTAGQDATWFDVLTAAAFLIFREEAVEWAVVEAGIGGRVDSTNVVNSNVAVITNVELEHTEVLGSTREAIAREKGGIIKPESALVTTLKPDDAAGRVLHDIAHQLNCSICYPKLPVGSSLLETNTSLAGLALDCLGQQGVLTRSHSDLNNRALGRWLLDDALHEAARLPGRMEKFTVQRANISNADASSLLTVSVILDGAHVPFSLKAVLQDLRGLPGLEGPCVTVMALGADKNPDGMLEVLSGRASTLICTELPRQGQSASAADLSLRGTALGIRCLSDPTPSSAFSQAMQIASQTGGWVLVTGSLYLIGLLRSLVAVPRVSDMPIQAANLSQHQCSDPAMSR
jgi:dihydrofolate synthase/folylpolyglutamate synthase